MYYTALAALLLASGSGAQDLAYNDNVAQAQRRGTPANQPHGYAPQFGACPSDKPTIRKASDLSSQESSWLPVRRNATVQPMRDLLTRINIANFDAGSYIDKIKNNASALPNIGIAVSGGGYRAMTNGAGAVAAFDNRTTNATAAGQLGGLLQSATYLSALSGGGWLVGSLYTNNFTSVQDIINTPDTNNTDLWQIHNTIFEGPPSGHSHILSVAGYYDTLIDQVKAKDDQGFNITITDYWGRALSFQLINATDGGPDYTFSSIATQDWFTGGGVPLPILVSDGRAPDEKIVSSNSTIYEFSPWELGSFDPTTYAFAPLKYVGTNFSQGQPISSSECVTGFDSASFIMGTSSSLFNAAITKVNGSGSSGVFSSALTSILSDLLNAWDGDGTDIASYPNPFYQYNNVTDPSAESPQLTLTDGGEDGQNIPLTPLIQPVREVDVIFAVDSTADTTDSNPSNGSIPNWPDGSSLVKTFQRSMTPIGNGTAFPYVPDTNSFVNLGLNNRPTFFGCNASNTTSPTPLIVYLPNAPITYYSNYSTFNLNYNDSERNAMINNGYNVATQGNGTIDSQWTTCVGCAILSRSLERTGTPVPDACTQCFNKYCWNGDTNSSTPAPYRPTLKLPQDQYNVTNTTSGAERWSLPISLAAACIGTAVYLNAF